MEKKIKQLILFPLIFGVIAIGIAGVLASNARGAKPILWLRFDEGYGTVAYDSSGNGINATINGATWKGEEFCRAGKCLLFDGEDDSVITSSISLPDVSGDVTWSVWFYWVDESGNYDTIVAKGGNVYGGWSITINTSSDEIWIFRNGGSAYWDTNFSVSKHKWYHLVLIHRSDDTLELYINGNLVGTTTNFDIGSLTDTIRIGYWDEAWSGGHRFNGFIDEIKIYDYPRTKSQIRAEYLSSLSSHPTPLGASVSLSSREKEEKNSLTEGLVLYLKMDENSGEVVKDFSGQGNDGTLGDGTCTQGTGTCPTWTGGKYGSALSFDGEDDYVKVPHNYGSFNFQEITLSAWIFPTTGGVYNPFIDKDFYDIYFEITPNNTLKFNGVIGKTILSINSKWYHVAATFKNGTIKIYVNGKLDVKGTGSLGQNYQPFYIGFGPTGGDEYFSGLIDEVRIYNRALSEKEIKALYEWAPPPVLHLKFDEKKGQYAYDSSGNGNDGILGGKATSESSDPTWRSARLCKYGGCLEFDGVNDYVKIQDSNWLNFSNSDFTVEGWCYSYQLTGDNQKVFMKYGSNTNILYSLGLNSSGYGTFALRDENRVAKIAKYSVNLIGQWHHLAGVKEGNYIKLYVDGILRAVEDISTLGSIDTTGNIAKVGMNPVYINDDQFYGLIDDIRIYNYARTQKQIIEDMNAGRPTISSPIGHTVLDLSFDEGYGQTAYDKSPYKNNGTIYGATWTLEGKIGKALSFDGVDDYVEVPDSPELSPTQAISISIWLKSNTAQTAKGVITKGPISGDYDYMLYFSGNGTVPLFYIKNSEGTSDSVGADFVWADGKWHHYVGIFDGDKLYLYIDGTLKGWKDTSLTDIRDSSNPLQIGRGWSSSNPYFSGLIDEVKIFPYALTDEEVKELYNQGKATLLGKRSSASSEYCPPGETDYCAPPVLHLRFDEKSGQIAYDNSAHGINCILGDTSGSDSRDPQWRSSAVCHQGGCLEFDGSDYVNCGNDSILDITDAITLEAWIKVPDVTNRYGMIVGKYETESGYLIRFDDTTGKVQAGIRDIDNVPHFTTGGYVLSNNTWYHIAGVYNGKDLIMYVNGIEYARKSGINKMMKSSTDAVWIGRSMWKTEKFSGLIDDVRIYNYARTPRQIAWDYSRGKPILYLKFDKGQGTTAYDWSGKGNHGTIYGATWTDNGKINRALSFDGVDDYVEASNSIYNFKAITISAWIKLTQVPSSYATIYFNGDTSSGNDIHLAITSDLALYARADKPAECDLEIRASPPNVITLNKWHYVAVVIDSQKQIMRKYVDGVLIDEDTYSCSIPTANYKDEIGRMADGLYNKWFFPGIIDELKIYNYALTEEQIKEEYNKNGLYFGPSEGLP